MVAGDSSDKAGTGRLSNRQRLLAEIRAAGPIGRAALAKRLGLSVQAASNITEGLLKAGLIAEQGRTEGARGQPATLYGLSPEGAFAIGFEVRPKALYATLIDMTGALRAQNRRALAASCPDEVLAGMQAQIADFGRDMPRAERLIGAGIVRPGPFGKTGLGPAPTELQGWESPDVPERIEAALGLPITIENDATAGACAEHQIGCAQGLDDFAYLYFGTGLGLGIISGGRPMSGAFGNSGEIGHLRLPGREGILEQHLSRAAVDQRMREAGLPAGRIEDLEAQLGAPALQGWLSDAAGALSEAIAIIENLFDPATIVLGGAMPRDLLSALIKATPLPGRTIANRPSRPLPRLQLGACGAFTVSSGAAALMLDQFFSRQF